MILSFSISNSFMLKDGRVGVERRLDTGLESTLGDDVTVIPFLTGVQTKSPDGGIFSDDTPSTAAVTLTVSLEVLNPSVFLPTGGRRPFLLRDRFAGRTVSVEVHLPFSCFSWTCETGHRYHLRLA